MPSGPDDRLAVGDDGVGELREQERAGRERPAALGGVLAVVEPDADDLARDRDRRDRSRRRRAAIPVAPLEGRGPAAQVVERRRARGPSPVRKPSMTGIRRSPTRTAVPPSSCPRYETRRIGGRLDQLADGAALARARRWPGRRCRSGAGVAVAAGVALGAARRGRRLRRGRVRRSGPRTASPGWSARPTGPRRPVIFAWSNVSSGRTRPQTIAWNGELIWSNRAMTGRSALGSCRPDRSGSVVERLELRPGPRAWRRRCRPGRG